MTDDIQKIIASLRVGDYEDPTQKIDLLAAALVEHHADVPLLLSLLRAPQVPLCLAAMEVSSRRTEGEILSELLKLAEHSEARIRTKLAEMVAERRDSQSADILRKLAKDDESEVRVAAIKSSTGREDCREIHEDALAQDEDWNVRVAAVGALDA